MLVSLVINWYFCKNSLMDVIVRNHYFLIEQQ